MRLNKATALRLNKTTTGRGFRLMQFRDRYGELCSLQESSADEPSVWFGCHDPQPKILTPGEGWQPVPLPDHSVLHSRMHLTQEQVQELLPYLHRFVETGRLGPDEPETDWPKEVY